MVDAEQRSQVPIGNCRALTRTRSKNGPRAISSFSLIDRHNLNTGDGTELSIIGNPSV